MDRIVDIYEDMDNDELLELNFVLYGIPRRVYERANPFHEFNDHEFFMRFRLRKETVLELLPLIEDRLEFAYDINNSVSPINQMLICLRVFATGGHLLSAADFGGVHVSTVSRIVRRAAEAIASQAPAFIKFPSTLEQRKSTQNSFYEIASFPRVLGIIDGTHIRIQSPGGDDAEIFRNRKNYFSINVQVVANYNYEITDIEARWPGSTHDSTIFNNCRLRRNFELNMFQQSILLGDSGYNVRNYLFTPLLNPSTEVEQLYNQAHIRTRARIENLFGIWKRRFPILAYGCRLKLDTILTVIVATAVLHNIARKNGETEPPLEQNEHILQMLIDEGQVPEIPVVQQNQDVAGLGFQARRNMFDNFFANLVRNTSITL